MPTLEERKARFEASKKAREQAEKNKSGFTPTEVPNFEYMSLGQDKCSVFRMVGESLEMRNKPTDPLMIERSMIKGDDDKHFFVIWSKETEHPLRQLQYKLARYKWDQTLNNGKGGPKYDHDGCPLLKRFLTNDDPNPMTSGALPKKWVLANVIDRSDEWCKKNKHTKLISWDTFEKDGKVYPTYGITDGMYKKIYDEKCTQIRRHFEDVDFVVRRYSKKTQPSESTHSAIFWYQNQAEIENFSEMDKTDYYKLINQEDYFSDEEQKYERYVLENIPFTSMTTPIGFIMKKWEKFIKAVDAKYSFGIWEACVNWKAKEISELRGTKTGQESTENKASVSENEDHDLPFGSEKEEKKVEDVKSTKVLKPKHVSSFTEAEIELFPGLSQFDENEKKLIKSIDLENQEVVWIKEPDSSCGQCEFALLDESTICPECGTNYR